MSSTEPLTLLRQVREAAGRTQAQMAVFFGFTGPNGRNRVAAWEKGEGNPPSIRHRTRFISYLGQELGIGRDREQFNKVWSILEKRWNWPSVTEYEWERYAVQKESWPLNGQYLADIMPGQLQHTEFQALRNSEARKQYAIYVSLTQRESLATWRLFNLPRDIRVMLPTI